MHQKDIGFASLPSLEITSSPTHANFLANLDADAHLPSNVNCQYFSTDEFHSDPSINECLFSLFLFCFCLVFL